MHTNEKSLSTNEIIFRMFFIIIYMSANITQILHAKRVCKSMLNSA